ncbi:MAG: 4-(cytidine 5'-diphospho)-2-C-methyl-D-erythritol kinase [Chitinophagaceae bacterium]|nr:4-(cytidine 5'-diphospho)-2-C-methyl-D-erythritol kinase [Chitinophagaceae bacterium]MCW5928876.1 4-(cytidine 5'-diphospho)-2-C-methyl-D-erythritol kinase [Chitinophagaceae bacterium]
MVVFPNCKINLGLNITSKRPDGFHNLETVFYPVQWTDALEVVKSGQATKLGLSGIDIPGDLSENICLKAFRLLKKDFPQLPAIDIHLHKTIPAGAGLGGGSADGAFMLTLLNKKFNLQLDTLQLTDYARQLGSDCPFFIINQPCFAGGRGDLLEPLKLPLDNYSLLIIHPGIHINTAWAFAQISPAIPDISIRELIARPVEEWKELLKNDFETPVFQSYPAIKAIKQKLYQNGAVFAGMSGSGSSVYGIFRKGTLPDLTFDSSYQVKRIEN